MSSADILGSGTSAYFNSKLLFSAHQNLISTRGHALILPNNTSSDTDFWKIKPPDFSPKLYRSLNLPRIKKNTLNPARLKDDWIDIPQRIGRMSQVISSKAEQQRNESPFTTSYRSPGSLEQKLLFVKSGKLPSIPYEDPKPHNFRPGAENLPDMVTSIEKDPGNLNFNIKCLRSRKTTVLYRLQLNEFVNTVPTKGFNAERVKVLLGNSTKVTFHFWDVGGQEKLRPLWKSYTRCTDGIVFVVDSVDVERMEEAKTELHKIIRSSENQGVPVLIVANKQDLRNSLTVSEIKNMLALGDLGPTTPWYLQPTCAIIGDGLREGLGNLYDMILKRRKMLRQQKKK